MIKQFFKNRIVANASWMIVGNIAQMLLSLIVGILTARYLGPSNYGLINYAGAYTTFFAAFCTLGINSVIVKEFVDNKGNEGQILGTALGMRFVSSLFSVVIINAISFFLDAGEPTTRIVVALYSISVIFNIFDTFNYWFQSQLQSKKTALATFIAYIVTTIYRVILLATGKPVELFALATSVDYLCYSFIILYIYRQDNSGKLSFSWAYGKKILSKSYHFILPSLMVAIYGQTDKIMLKHMISSAEIGYYSTAVALCSMWCFVLHAIIDSLTPPIMQAHSKDHVEFCRLNRLLYCIVFYLSAFVSVLFTIFGKFAVGLLYGKAFLPAAAPLKVITWYTAFSYLGVARNAWVVCENKQKYILRIYLSAAISNVFFNLIFIPPFGSVGAAFASLAAQVITTIVAPLFIKDMKQNSILMFEAIFFRGLKK